MNKIILAPAGGRKTQTIVERCMEGNLKKLVITYTSTGQNVIKERILQKCSLIDNVEVLGWYSFLLNHIIKPYVSDKYPLQKVQGFHYVEKDIPNRFRKGPKRYFDDENKVYSHNISKLAVDIAKASQDAWIDRLEGIYDEIYFDEVQDLGGNDLDILSMLYRSKIVVTSVGDVRQSLYTTSRSDTKYKKYQGLNKILWFREMEKRGLCKVEEKVTTWRCNQEIIDLADSVLPRDLELPKTNSMNYTQVGHDGIFVVSWKNLAEYISKFNPACYRHSKNSQILPGSTAINFGQCKGQTVEHGLIYPTNPIKKWLKNPKNKLTNQSASSFYVALTRAMYSVAIVVENPEKYNMKEWCP